MADVPGKFFSAKKVRTGVSPSSPGVIEGETLPPLNPPGGALNSVGLTMPSAFNVANSPLTSNGTLAVTGAGTVGQYIRGDGSLADFPESSGGGSSVSYYLNGSISQGTIGGVAYKELNKVPILGAGTDFTINADGYIASFITDAGDPNLLEIPGGNWNFETYFSASSSGGTPTFYVELYKVSGTTATLIASSSATPEFIAFGTTLTSYFSTLAVPQTTLALTDRLAIRYYVNHSGRTITLHTEDNHLCQVITTFTTGLTALNGLTAQVQNFAVGTSGSDFNIASATATHTFNLPTASATNRGALSSADWSTFNAKQNALTLTTTGTSGAATLVGATLNIPQYQAALTNPVTGTGSTGQVAYWSSGSAITGESELFWDATNNRLGIGITPTAVLDVRGPNALGTFFNARNDGAAGALFERIGNTFPFNRYTFSNGVIGINTPSPSGALHIVNPSGAGQPVLELQQQNSGSNIVQWRGSAGTYLGVISENGNVGIGTVDPTSGFNARLAVRNEDAANNPTLVLFKNVNSASSEDIFRVQSWNGAFNTVASIRANGSANFSGSITASSFIRSGGTSSQYLMADGSVSTLTNPVTGTGVSGRVAFWNGTNSITSDADLLFNGSELNVSGIKIDGSFIPYIISTLAGSDLNIQFPVGQGLAINNNSAENIARISKNNFSLTGASTIQTSTGNLTISTGGGNGSIILTPNGSGTTTINSSVTASSFIRSGGTSSQYLMADGSVSTLSNPVTGTGTTNYLPKFTGSTTIGNSQIFDNGTGVGIGTTSPQTVSSGFTLTVGDGATQQQPYLALSRNSLGGFWAGIRWYDGNTIKSVIQEDSDFNLRFSTSNAEAMRMFAGQNVHIGPTPASDNGARLQVSGTATISSTLTAGADINLQSNESYVNLFSSYVVGLNSRARFRAVGAGGGSGYGGDFRLDTRATNNAWNTDVFVVNSSGNVGIGTPSPSTLLHVNGTTTQITLQNVNGGTNAERIGMFMTDGDIFKILSLNDNNTTRVDNIITANVLSGNVGIGTTSPLTKLQVQTASNRRFFVSDTGSQVQIGGLNDAGSDYVPTAIDGTRLLLNAFSGGNVLIGTQSDAASNQPLQVVKAGSSNYLRVQTDNNASYDAGGLFTDGTNNVYYGMLRGTTGLTGAFSIFTGGNTRFNVTSGGNVLIGTTTDNGNLLRVDGQVFINANTQFDSKTTTGVASSNVAIANFSNAEGSTYYITATDGTNYYRAILLGIQNSITVVSSLTTGTVPSRSFVISSNILNMSFTSGTWTVKCTQIRTV